MMKNRSGEKIRLTGIDELLGVVNEESAMEAIRLKWWMMKRWRIWLKALRNEGLLPLF